MLPIVLLSVLAQAAPQTSRPKLAVLDLTAGAGIDQSVTTPLGEAITTEVQKRGFFEVLSQRDISTMLGVERQKQLMGCSDDATSCLAELSGALGARFVMSGTVARLGDAYQLTLNTLDTQKAQPLGRSTKLAKDLGSLQLQIPWAVAEATSTPAPAPPSRVFSYALIGVGAAAAMAGLVLGILALNVQGQLQGELDSGGARAGVLKDRTFYEQQIASVQSTKGIALGLLCGGAVLATLGIVLMPKDIGGAQVALVPYGSGAALAGVFP